MDTLICLTVTTIKLSQMNVSDVLFSTFDHMNPTKGVIHPKRAWPVGTPSTQKKCIKKKIIIIP